MNVRRKICCLFILTLIIYPYYSEYKNIQQERIERRMDGNNSESDMQRFSENNLKFEIISLTY